MANTASAVKVIIDGQDYGQVKVTNSAGSTSTVMGLAPSGGSTGYQRALIVRDRLNNLFASGSNLEFITPGIRNGEYVVHHVPWSATLAGGSLIVTATNEDSSHHGMTRWYLTLVWANAVRTAIDKPALCTDLAGNPGRLQLVDAGKQGVNPVVATLDTTATYYSYETPYRTTASMECWHPYDNSCAMYAMTVADSCPGDPAKYVPFGTYVRVTNKNNNVSIIVRVNDRGPAKHLACGTPKKLLDLSRGAAEAIGFDFNTGSIPVTIERLS